MNVEIVSEAALFPEKEYINGIAVAVQRANFMFHFFIGEAICPFEKHQRTSCTKVETKFGVTEPLSSSRITV
jgi:hypothetical protein